MALTHVSAQRDALADLIVDAVDAGATDPGGDLIITTSTTGTTLCSIQLQDPAFGAASSGTATMNGSPSATATATGTAALFRMASRANAEVFRGTVGTTGSDINLSSTSISSGDKVQITSFTYSSSA